MNAGRPLDGLRVIELGDYVASPLAGMMFGDLGADVVKIERTPGGDPSRRFGHAIGDVSAQYLNCNRNKRSVALDLKSERGLSDARYLLSKADIAVFGMRAAALDRLGLRDDALSAANPRLIRAYITGYGNKGPMAGAPAYDSLLQAMSGLAYVQGNGTAPALVRTFIADKMAAFICVQSVLAAVIERHSTGIGASLSTSMLDAMAYFNFPDMMVTRTEIDGDPASPDIDAVGQAMRPIRAQDGWLIVTPVSGAQIARAFEAVGRPEARQQLRAITDRALLARRLVELLEEATMNGPVAHWLKLLAEADVPAAPVHSIDSHLADRQITANDVYGEYSHPQAGRLRDVRYPTIFHDRPPLSTYLPAPALGQHSQDVLAQNGPR